MKSHGVKITQLAQRSFIVIHGFALILIELLHQPDLLTTRKQFTVAKMANGSMLRRGYI